MMRISLSGVVLDAAAKIEADPTAHPHNNLELVHVVEQILAEIPAELGVP